MTQPELAENVWGKGRWYRDHPDGPLRWGSVTNIIGQLPKPALERWKTNMTKAAIHEWLVGVRGAAIYDPNRLVARMASLEVSRATEWFMEAPFRVSSEAAARGDKAHQELEELGEAIRTRTIDKSFDLKTSANGYIRGFGHVMEILQADVVATEVTVLNATVGFMGSADAVFRLGNGALIIGDYKTSRKGRLYPEVALQLTALAEAEFIVASDGSRRPMPKIDGMIGIALTGEGEYSIQAVTNRAAAWETFKAARQIFGWRYDIADTVLSKPLTDTSTLVPAAAVDPWDVIADTPELASVA